MDKRINYLAVEHGSDILHTLRQRLPDHEPGLAENARWVQVDSAPHPGRYLVAEGNVYLGQISMASGNVAGYYTFHTFRTQGKMPSWQDFVEQEVVNFSYHKDTFFGRRALNKLVRRLNIPNIPYRELGK